MIKNIFLIFLIFIVIQFFFYKNNEKIKKNNIKACIVILLQNKDFENLKYLIQRFDLLFNNKYQYPYVLFNNDSFPDNFVIEISKHTKSLIEIAKIDSSQWSVPYWIEKSKLNNSLKKIGFSIGYRHMCRFYSGFFFRHPITLKYDYYIRLDTDSKFECEFQYDPFLKLKTENIKYGFILAHPDGAATIPTLWETIKNWTLISNIDLNSEENKKGISFISNDYGQSINEDICIFYNNFEIGSFSVYRNEKYLNFFEFLDKSGGFYYERWVFIFKIYCLYIIY